MMMEFKTKCGPADFVFSVPKLCLGDKSIRLIASICGVVVADHDPRFGRDEKDW
jgi:hypothetical protein